MNNFQKDFSIRNSSLQYFIKTLYYYFFFGAGMIDADIAVIKR